MQDQLASDATDRRSGSDAARRAPPPPPGQRPAPEAPDAPAATPPDEADLPDGWRRVILDGRSVAVREVAEVLRDGVEIHAVGAPRLLADREARPVLSLTALLAAEPDPDTASLAPLIETGQLAIEASCGLDPAEIEALSRRLGRRAGLPPGAETALALTDAGAPVDARTALGAGASIALSGRLARAATVEVVNAMNEAADPTTARLLLAARIGHRSLAAPRRLRLRGRWVDVWDALTAQADGGDRLPAAAVEAVLMQLLDDGRLTLTGVDGGAIDDLESACAMFARVSGFVLTPHPAGGVTLRDRPAAAFPLDVTEDRRVSAAGSLTLETALAPEIARLFRGRPLDGHLGFVALAAGGGRQVSEPWRVASRSRAELPAKRADPVIALSAGQALSAATALRPVVKLTPVSHAQNLSAGSVLDPLRPHPGHAQRPRSLPVVTDHEATRLDGLLRDRVSARLRWYAPEFALADPAGDPGTDAEPAFRFEIERIGATADGTPALRADLAFRLIGAPPAGLAAEVARLRQEGTVVRTVEMRDVAATLVVPFVDSGTGQTRRQRLPCETFCTGEEIRCRVRIADQWVRLAYGALSRSGFQSEPACVEVSYQFESYAPLDARGHGALIGAKQRRIGDVLLGGEEIRVDRGAGAITFARPGRETPLAATVATPLAAHAGIGTLAIRPQLDVSAALVAALSRTIYAERLRGVQRRTAALVSCTGHPDAYVERTATGPRVLGCQDALLLGRGEPALLEEIVPLGGASARIYRLVTQPDLFLVLPARYRLTRRAAGGLQVPAIALYSILDAEMDDNTRFVFDFMLQPDLSPAERRETMLRLAPYSPAPVLRYPGEMPLRDVAVNVLVGAETLHANDGPFLSVSVSGGLSEAMLVKSLVEGSGLRGSARFTFDDGTPLESAIDISIAQIAGPWDTGPVEAVPEGQRIRLTNRTESEHEVTGILAVAPFARLAAARRLASGESVGIDTDAPHEEAYAIAAASAAPGSIEERRAFVEDVRSSVIFMALVDFDGLGIAAIEVDAELVLTGERHGLTLSAAVPAAEMVFRLPITQLLSRPRLGFTTVRVGTDGGRIPSGRQEADLSESAVIQITAGARA